MRAALYRLLAVGLSAVLLAGCFTACTDTAEDTDGVLDNGNVITAVEEGTEEELTAVRENLIKYSEIEGFGTVDKMEYYENGVRTVSDEYVQVKDNKKFYYAGDTKRLVNYTDGYMLDMPADWTPDFSLSSAVCRFASDDVTLIPSNETESYKLVSVEDGSDPFAKGKAYIDLIFRYITTDAYYRENAIEKIAEETITIDERQAYVLRLYLTGCEEGTQCYYTYVVIYDELNAHQLMFKCVDDRDFADVYTSFQGIYDKGAAIDTLAYPCNDNPSWTPETKALYDDLMNTDHVVWGLANGNITEDPLRMKYPMIEKTLDFTFPMVSTYTDQMEEPFPVEDAQKITEDGRFLQFTMHFQYSWGETMGEKAPILDVYRGELDEEFREFARGIVEYGQPLLFRLNNEMNSDWTNWSAVNAMLDPDIFTATWQRMYDIFEEEGANAYCIWVWNPQSDYSFPDAKWNDVRRYMPGADYMHMLGLTYYNFGDESTWGSFELLYTALETYYGQYFSDWGWIISEFGCSDTDEDKTRKAQWITDMFTCFENGMYPNIKAAVWFNANDYTADGQILHEIVLTDDPVTLEAFKEGLKRTQ